MPNLVLEVPKPTMRELRQKTRLIGAKKALAVAAGIHPNTITNVLLRGTADSVVLQKLTTALQAA